MYCSLFYKYVNSHECNICDERAGFPEGSFLDCTAPMKHHPIIPNVKWWLRPTGLKFKLYIVIRWITRRLPLKKNWTIWSDRYGLHVGVWRPGWSWIENEV